MSKSRANRPCRNILIHGYCKFEGKGCEFNHESSSQSATTPSSRAANSPFSFVKKPINAEEEYLQDDVYDFDRGSSSATTNLAAGHRANYLPGQFGDSSYFYTALQYHLATNPLPHVSNLTHNQKSIHAFFMSDKLKEDLLRRNEVTLRVSVDNAEVPVEIHNYHSLFPLEERLNAIQGITVDLLAYKGISKIDGKPYCLVRLAGYRLSNEHSIGTIEGWRKIRHANIVSVREAFTTKQFGDNSLVFAFDYHPLSVTVGKRYFQRPHPDIPEKTLWSFAIQVVSALKTVHGAGLACRTLGDPSLIIICGKNRFRLQHLGILDMLMADSNTNSKIQDSQMNDLVDLGHLLLRLALNDINCNFDQSSLDRLPPIYSSDFRDFISILCSVDFGKDEGKKMDKVIGYIGSRVLHDINNVHQWVSYNDFLEFELSKELENGRLVRLLCKLGMMNERPDYDMDPEWSETGDRYFLKLFRDYVFHQVDDDGRPVIDFAHIIQCLNKLDAGSHEKLMLMSRDEANCLIVSYKDIKKCLETSFSELLLRSKSK